jgi:hypothetical protein
VALGVLAGLGIAATARMLSQRRLAAGLLALAALGLTAAGTDLGPCRLMALPTGAQVPPVYRELAQREPGPVLELPVGVTLKEVPSAVQNTWYEYFSIFHWRPLVNGYASYWPPRLEIEMPMARALPAARALANLVDCTRVRWIVAHTEHMAAHERDAFSRATPGLRLVERFGDDLLFEVAPMSRSGSCATSFRDTTRSIEGTPLARLDPQTRRAAVDFVEPASELSRPNPPASIAVPIRIRNDGGAAWPAVALDDTYLVRLSYAWRDGLGRPLPFPWRHWTRLPVDLRPGESIDVPVAVRLPPYPGRYQLDIVVRQGLQGSFELSGLAAAPTPVVVR